MDMATLWAMVWRNFVMISPKPHLRLARLNRRSTSTRSHSSRNGEVKNRAECEHPKSAAYAARPLAA